MIDTIAADFIDIVDCLHHYGATDANELIRSRLILASCSLGPNSIVVHYHDVPSLFAYSLT